MVYLNTCISLEPTKSNDEPCMLEIKLTNHQRISRIAVVSEAYVLEFFKQFGEYETTVFAEVVDEFPETTIFFAETAIVPSSTEASIKFTRTKCKNSVMWIYGIRLYLTEPNSEPKRSLTDIFNPQIIKNFLTKLNSNEKEPDTSNDVRSQYKNILNSLQNKTTEESDGKETAQCISENSLTNITDIKAYIDNKFHDMELKIMKRMDEMEQNANQKLDTILKQLETQFIVK
ncbi:uncharacterized protein LOC143183614 isoform X2 [Calliopsis andreniformis]